MGCDGQQTRSGMATVVACHAGTTPKMCCPTDFNRDGKLDYAVTNTDDNTVGVRRGNGDGTFQATVTTITGLGTVPRGIAEAHTFFVGDGQWLVHNECWKKAYNGREYITFEERTISDAAIDAASRARMLADELRRVVPPWANRQVTVGVAVNEGRYYVTAFKPDRPEVWSKIEGYLSNKAGYQWVDNTAPAGSNLAHAERTLYDQKNFTSIGISNTQGPCEASCEPFFKSLPDVDIAWPLPK